MVSVFRTTWLKIAFHIYHQQGRGRCHCRDICLGSIPAYALRKCSLGVHVTVQAQHQRAGVRFLQHDVHTEYDDLSDVARLYRVRATPSFAFFVDGSKVAHLFPPACTLPDHVFLRLRG